MIITIDKIKDRKKHLPTIPIIQRGFSLCKEFVLYLTALISMVEKSTDFYTPKS